MVSNVTGKCSVTNGSSCGKFETKKVYIKSLVFKRPVIGRNGVQKVEVLNMIAMFLPVGRMYMEIASLETQLIDP